MLGGECNRLHRRCGMTEEKNLNAAIYRFEWAIRHVERRLIPKDEVRSYETNARKELNPPIGSSPIVVIEPDLSRINASSTLSAYSNNTRTAARIVPPSTMVRTSPFRLSVINVETKVEIFKSIGKNGVTILRRAMKIGMMGSMNKSKMRGKGTCSPGHGHALNIFRNRRVQQMGATNSVCPVDQDFERQLAGSSFKE